MKELIKKILREEYSPAGKEIIPNEIVVHKSNPMFRDNIMSEGLKARAGECYRIYAGYGEKCIPAIFATNSKNKRAWFDSTYDDDIWFIDTTKIPDVKWFKDRHYESTKKHIVTFQDIPKDALTLFYEGTGSGDVKTWNKKSPNLYENKDEDFSVEKNIKIINLLLSEISWDGLCDMWVEYNQDDGEYEIRSKTTSRNKEFDEELSFLDRTLSSMGLRVFIFAPWFVDNCEDEIEFLNESRNKSSKDLILRVLNDLVLPQYNHVICDFEVKDTEERLDITGKQAFNYPSVTVTFIGGHGTKLWPRTQAVQKMYDDLLDEVWDTVWDYTGISVELYSKYVKDCGKENIYLRESENKKSNYLSVIEEIVQPFTKNVGICDIETWYDDIDDMYSVYLVFGTKELNDWFTSENLSSDSKFYYIKQKIKEVQETIKRYLPIENIHVGSYGKPHCGVESLNE